MPADVPTSSSLASGPQGSDSCILRINTLTPGTGRQPINSRECFLKAIPGEIEKCYLEDRFSPVLLAFLPHCPTSVAATLRPMLVPSTLKM